MWRRIYPAAQIPATAQVFLQDDSSAYRLPAHLLLTWTHTRLLLLQCIWDVRCSAAGEAGHTAAAVVSCFVQRLQQQVSRDWRRVTTDIRWNAGVPASWFRGRDPQLSLEEFKRKWCVGGVVARVVEGQADSCEMEFRLRVGQL